MWDRGWKSRNRRSRSIQVGDSDVGRGPSVVNKKGIHMGPGCVDGRAGVGEAGSKERLCSFPKGICGSVSQSSACSMALCVALTPCGLIVITMCFSLVGPRPRAAGRARELGQGGALLSEGNKVSVLWFSPEAFVSRSVAALPRHKHNVEKRTIQV